MADQELFLRAVQTAEIELYDRTLAVMAADAETAQCFWQYRQHLCSGFRCQFLEIYVGDRLIASSRLQPSGEG